MDPAEGSQAKLGRFFPSSANSSSAKKPNTVLLAVPSAGVADEAIGSNMGLIPATIIRPVVGSRHWPRGRGPDELAGGVNRAAYDASRNVGWPEAGA
jgi:hypothetical protein